MKIQKIINLMASDASTLKKIDILTRFKDTPMLKETFYLCYNKRIVFGVNKIPDYTNNSLKGTKTLKDAYELLAGQLATRKLTGNSAVTALSIMFSSLDDDDRETLRRVIKRDLECGASESSACKVWGDGFIPSQPCMKAESYSKKAVDKLLKKKGRKVAQLKADGTRCMIVKCDGKVNAYSRSGLEFTGLPILDTIANSSDDNFVIDGELVYITPVAKSLDFMFSDDVSAGVVDRQTGNGIISKALKNTITYNEAKNVNFQCWDYIDVNDYWAGFSPMIYEDRLEIATTLVGNINDPRVTMIESEFVETEADAIRIYERYIELGLEGIILKWMGGYWEDTRSKDQVKFKQVIDIDMVIVGYYAHSKDPNKLGGFTIQSKCGTIQCKVGSGFTDTTHKKVNGKKVEIPLNERKENDREVYMLNALKMIGTVGEIECNGVLARKGAKPGEAPYKLFLPVWVRHRIDKNATDANTFDEIFGK